MKLNKTEILYIFCLASCVFLLRVVILFYDLPFYFLILIYPISFITLSLAWIAIRNIHHYLDKVMPYNSPQFVWRIVLEVLAGTATALTLINIIFFLADYQFSFFEVDQKLRITTHISVVLMVLLINALFLGYYYFQHWKIALLQAAKLEKEKALTQKYLAQLQFINLQNQLNPHFLFNSITSLNSLIFENQQLASDFLKQLAKVYRYVLQHKEKELVALQTELTFIQSYLSLLKTRFGEVFRYQIDIEEVALQRQIPPVTLQVLVENAIKHNVMTLESPLCVEIKSEKDYLKVSNNLQKKSIVATSNKIGLENLKSLYGFLTSENIEIIESRKSFIIKLPFI
ncbi:MAG: hypothetical protein OHK0053_36160 [Microscillaceae bacterium]